jgi:hypothetical protein
MMAVETTEAETTTAKPFTVIAAAAELGVTTQHVYRWIRDGALRTFPVNGSAVLVEPSSLTAFKASGGPPQVDPAFLQELYQADTDSRAVTLIRRHGTLERAWDKCRQPERLMVLAPLLGFPAPSVVPLESFARLGYDLAQRLVPRPSAALAEELEALAALLSEGVSAGGHRERWGALLPRSHREPPNDEQILCWVWEAAGILDYFPTATPHSVPLMRAQRVESLAQVALQRAGESEPPEGWMVASAWQRQQVKAEAAWLVERIRARIDFDGESVTDRIGWPPPILETTQA